MAESTTALAFAGTNGAPTNLRLRPPLTAAGVVHPNSPQLAPPTQLPAHADALPALTEAEELAVAGLVSVGADDTVAFVRHRAAALAGDAATGSAGVRRRSLAKAVAIVEAQLSQMQAVLAAAIAKRDVAAVALLDRAATGATKRFAILMDALRADEQRHQRPVVVVGAANAVNIGGGG